MSVAAHRLPPLLLAAIAMGMLAGCASDEPTVGATTGTAGATEAASPDPLTDDLVVQVQELRATVEAARALLAAASDEPEAAREAVATLTADDRLAGVEPDVAPLFPGPLTSREETIDYDDAFSETLTAARAAGGPFAESVSHVLADQIAGDVGIWQRDAQGMLDAIDEAAHAASVEEAEAEVLALPGEGTRALAYALLAARAADEEQRAAYVERAIAHLDLILRALTDVLATGGERGA